MIIFLAVIKIAHTFVLWKKTIFTVKNNEFWESSPVFFSSFTRYNVDYNMNFLITIDHQKDESVLK